MHHKNILEEQDFCIDFGVRGQASDKFTSKQANTFCYYADQLIIDNKGDKKRLRSAFNKRSIPSAGACVNVHSLKVLQAYRSNLISIAAAQKIFSFCNVHHKDILEEQDFCTDFGVRGQASNKFTSKQANTFYYYADQLIIDNKGDKKRLRSAFNKRSIPSAGACVNVHSLKVLQAYRSNLISIASCSENIQLL